jgi:NADH:ubiquinone oxidoreductase subunit 6 (subunit J)
MTDTAIAVGPAFWILATVIVVGSLGVVMSRNMVHSALFLALVLLMAGGLYLNLEAGLLAGFQVLIYVGAVVTLMLIAIMLIQNIAARDIIQTNPRGGLAALVSVATGAVMIYVLREAQWTLAPHATQPLAQDVALRDVCYALLDTYLLPFEVASVVLLVALVGAIVFAQHTQAGERAEAAAKTAAEREG